MSTTAPTRRPAVLPGLRHVAAERLRNVRPARVVRRVTQLFVGLVLYGLSLALMVRADLGVAPWDVLHSGLARHLPLTLGQAVVLMSFVVLLVWVPLREKPGVGTVANAFVVGFAADASLAVLTLLPAPGALPVRVAVMVGGVVLCGLATAVYIGARLGRGPRDGLMTGLARVTGQSIRLVRTLLEVTVVVLGLLLGGRLGLGTVVFALAIGPVTQALLPHFEVAERRGREPAREPLA